MTLTKLNNFLTKFVQPLDIINIVVGLLIGLAHVYLPLPTLGGFLFGCLLSLSSSYMIGINYFFTSTSPPAKEKEYINSPKSNFFIGFSLLMLALSMIGSFFGTYTHLNLLIPAVAEKTGIVIGNGINLGISIVFAINFATSTLIHSWIHIHSLWNRLRPEKEAASVQTEKSTNVVCQKLDIHPTTLKPPLEPALKITPKLAQNDPHKPSEIRVSLRR